MIILLCHLSNIACLKGQQASVKCHFDVNCHNLRDNPELVSRAAENTTHNNDTVCKNFSLQPKVEIQC